MRTGTTDPIPEKDRLIAIARVFLKLGCIGFGGPAVHIALMEEEIVRKRKWISPEYFIDLIGATNLIPGPNSTEMSMHCGRERAGWKGLIVAGCCFIIPAVIITGIFAWAYKRYGNLPEVQPYIYGIKPAIIAIILSAMIRLGRKTLKTLPLAFMGLLCFIACLAGLNEFIVLFGAGLAGILLQGLKNRSNKRPGGIVPAAALPAMKLFWIFLKIGAMLYGSGYVLFAFLDRELVHNGWLSRQELIDAIAVGQFTPGPVFSAATFIGWQIGGIGGAAAATIGIFLPSFLFVAFLNPLIPWLRRSAIMSSFLDAVNAASIAIILSVCVTMGKDVFQDGHTVAIALTSLAAILTFKKLNTAFIVFGGALMGYILTIV